MEIWKDIPDYEGHYQISNLGRVKSLARKVKRGNNSIQVKEKFLKPFLVQRKHGEDYCTILLCKNCRKKHFTVKTLVAILFMDYVPSKYTWIDLKDGDATNCSVDNIRISTMRDNAEKKFSKTKKKSRYRGVTYHKENKKWIAKLKLNGKTKYFGSFDKEYDAHIAYELGRGSINFDEREKTHKDT